MNLLFLKADEFARERDIELAGEGTFEWEAGGVGSWGASVGVVYESTDDLCDDFSEGIKVLADGGARFHNVCSPRGAWDNGREKAPAAMLRKAIVANTLHRDHGVEHPEFEIWGSGNQRRSFLFIDDAADAVVNLLKSKYREPVNIGSDRSVTIRKLTDIALRCVGTPPLNVRYIPPKDCLPGVNTVGVASRSSNNKLVGEKLGWRPKNSLEEGMRVTGDWIGDGGALGPNDGMAVGMLLVLGFGCANGPEEGAGSWVGSRTLKIALDHQLERY